MTEGEFAELRKGFLAEKSRAERRLAQLDTELAAAEPAREKDGLLRKARELLKLETLPRELAVALIEKLEIGERNPDSGEQEVRVYWRF